MRATRIGHLKPNTHLAQKQGMGAHQGNKRRHKLDNGSIIEINGLEHCPECKATVPWVNEGSVVDCGKCGYRFRPIAAKKLRDIRNRRTAV